MVDTTTHDVAGGSWEALQKADRAAMILGALIAVAGIVAIIAGFVTAAAVVTAVAFLLVAAGLLRLVSVVQEFRRRDRRHLVRGVAASALYVITGALMIAWPEVTILAVTMALALLFLAGGIVRITASVLDRQRGWKWEVAGGVISVLLGIIAIASWPYSSAWLIGVLVGVELIFAGSAVMAAGYAMRKLVERGEEDSDRGVRRPLEQPVLH
jgi:uncharacterized membrane protein HdeD (DUF308 family)